MRLAFVASALLIITACASRGPYSSSAYTVSGKLLSAEGDPVPNTLILLFPKAKGGGVYGQEASGVTGQDGSFTINRADGKEGVTGGFYGVVIRPQGTPTQQRKAQLKVPKKLWVEESTDMEVEITADKRDWEIRLKK
jgi:hypothetical protein